MFRKQMLAAALLMVAPPSLATAAVERVSVRIDGLACPFCTYNIEKRVKTLDGVERDARVVTSVERGIATFPWKPVVAFDPTAVRQAVRQAGFTPREISVTMTGTVEISREGVARATLVDKEVNLAVSVQPDVRADRLESWETLKTLAGRENLRVQVEGEVQSSGSGESWKVVLYRWAPLEFGSAVVVEVEDLASEECSTRTMRALRELDGVIHVEADHETDRVSIWTYGKSPDMSVFRERIETLGFKVTHIHEREVAVQDD